MSKNFEQVVDTLTSAEILHFSFFTYEDIPISARRDFCVLKPKGQLAFTLNTARDLGRTFLPVDLLFSGSVSDLRAVPNQKYIRWDVTQGNSEQGQVFTSTVYFGPRQLSSPCNGLLVSNGASINTDTSIYPSFASLNQITVTLVESADSVISVSFNNIQFVADAATIVPLGSIEGRWDLYAPGRVALDIAVGVAVKVELQVPFTGRITYVEQSPNITTAIQGFWDLDTQAVTFQTYPLSPDLSDLSLPEYSYSGTLLSDGVMAGMVSPAILEDIESVLAHFPLPPSQPWTAIYAG